MRNEVKCEKFEIEPITNIHSIATLRMVGTQKQICLVKPEKNS